MLKKLNINDYYDNHTKESDLRNPYVYYIIRPLSFLFMPFLVKFNTHPSFITFSRLFFGLITFLLISNNNFQQNDIFFFSIIFNFIIVLDYVDGNLARYFKIKSFIGKMYDGWIDTCLEIGLFISVGVYLGNENIFWGVFVSLIMIFSIWTSQRYTYIEILKSNYLKGKKEINKKSPITPKRSRLYIYVNNIFSHKIDNFKIIYFTIVFSICTFYHYVNEWHYYGGIYLLCNAIIQFLITVTKSIKSFRIKYD